MKWIKRNDCFLLNREELAQLALFNVAWKFAPKKERPMGYDDFHKQTLIPACMVLGEYLTSKVKQK